MTSIIICTVDPAKFDAARRNYRDLLGAEAEVIGIHDAKSLAEGYMRGIARSRGDLLVFAHDDAAIHSRELKKQLAYYRAQYDVFGVAGTSRVVYPVWTASGPPYLYGQVAHYSAERKLYQVNIYSAPSRCVSGMQGLDGVWIAASRGAAEVIGFDSSLFDGFHLYDLDFTFSAFRRGMKLGVCCDLGIVHESPGTYDHKLNFYIELFAQKHKDALAFGLPRPYEIPRVLVPSVEEAMERMTPGHWGAPPWQ
ncbi:MAG: glycosyltransferase [Tepidisphaeraceae bacterium]